MNLHYKITTAIVLFIALFTLSCENPFNPGIENKQNNPETLGYPPTTPDNVLRNLTLAYNQKDIELYKSCLSKSFRFQILNSDISAVGVDWWGFEQEVEYHTNLFSKGSSDGSFASPDNILLTLEIPPQSSWINDNQIGHENWVIILCPFYLHLYYNYSSDITAIGYARFYLKQEAGRWVIAIWVDESIV
ncbi:MAG TPA: hypothetical protein PL063_01335 [Candidatus Cloacimonadota bacterium]|jgi:hypothetical protein|nr:hypothetical protein [Candidatus Cloacimonadales bacterium]HPY95835.1 hypothetical protein [Candidatus Cloacimonadota bacterium]HQB40537.1 hypothetical protein [Candidatus Cloacimonadota bacterium]